MGRRPSKWPCWAHVCRKPELIAPFENVHHHLGLGGRFRDGPRIQRDFQVDLELILLPVNTSLIPGPKSPMERVADSFRVDLVVTVSTSDSGAAS